MGTAPNYIVIGAAKCGTSSICALLGNHPDVFMSDPREPHYFSKDEGFDESWSWYVDLFQAAEGATAIGEGSTSYTKPAAVHRSSARIAAALPNCRLIYVLRDPIARLESDWKMRHQQGQWSYQCINEAVVQQPKLVWHGLYWTHLNVYRKYFADDRIHISFFEDFVKSPDTEMQRIFRYLGVDPFVQLPESHKTRNRAEDRRSDRALLKALRRWPGFRRLRAVVPDSIVQPATAVLTRHPPPPQIEWDPRVRESVASQLRSDAVRLLRFTGKPVDFWKLT